jgi:PPOX class probable F420-dependent enzyme
VRSGLAVDDLGDLLASRVLATLATYGPDGRVRLSPVWFEWRDGGFNVVVGADDVKSRHLRADPGVALAVYENEPPYRGLEIRSEARLISEGAAEADRRLALRYLGRQRGEAYVASLDWQQVLVRIEPGELRVWDFADEWPDAGP